MASQRSGKQLQQIAELVDGGHLRPVISAQRPLSEIVQLHSEGGAGYGKIALIIDKALAAQ